MTKVLIEPGICKLNTTVHAEMNEDEEIVLTVHSGCDAIKNMMEELGDTFDPMEVCLVKPGAGPFYEYAQAHFPIHVACPAINGILKAMEAEAGLALKCDAAIKFLD